MKKIVVFLFFIAGAAAAQTTPALISDTRVLANDSPLVAAAKRALAARRAAAAQTAWVIDDGMVRHRVLVEPPAAAQLPTVASAPAAAAVPSTFSSNDGTAARQQAERQRAALQRELQIMAEEYDQPYGGVISEDHVVQRMTQIPAQIEATKPPR